MNNNDAGIVFRNITKRYGSDSSAALSGPVKVAVRPEAWRIHRQGAGLLPARLDKRAYLGAVYEYTFETALGHIFVVS
eukprot:gene16613-16794_t